MFICKVAVFIMMVALVYFVIFIHAAVASEQLKLGKCAIKLR